VPCQVALFTVGETMVWRLRTSCDPRVMSLD
jgi:hypothetical protein